MASGKIVIVRTTVPDRRSAVRLAGTLVDARLAACVQFHTIESVYRWKGKVERAREYAVEAKVPARLATRLVRAVKKLHGYELPEIIVLPVAEGLAGYIEWVAAETRGKKDR